MKFIKNLIYKGISQLAWLYIKDQGEGGLWTKFLIELLKFIKMIIEYNI